MSQCLPGTAPVLGFLIAVLVDSRSGSPLCPGGDFCPSPPSNSVRNSMNQTPTRANSMATNSMIARRTATTMGPLKESATG